MLLKWQYSKELAPAAQGSNVFAGKHGFITPRDLFKWAARGAVGYQELAESGFLLLGERLRQPAERAEVLQVIEATLNVKVQALHPYPRTSRAAGRAPAAAPAAAPFVRLCCTGARG